LEDSSTNSNQLTGKELYYSFLAGAHKVFENEQAINKINVFPVPDGDTGTNLASTMQSILDTPIPTKSIKQTAVALADAALLGARGNSGIIFAQFLYGFSNEMDPKRLMDINHFAEATAKASEYTYAAVANPVEGTMITVIREWAEHIDSIKDKFDDFRKLIIDSYSCAKQSLVETKDKLEVLKKNNVVDAGAKGFVDFLDGMSEFLKHGEVMKILRKQRGTKLVDIKQTSHDNYNFRYCTEGLLSGEGISQDKVKGVLTKYGDSLVVAGSDARLRFHIHTDKPEKLFNELGSYGILTNQKVDDMAFQDEIVHKRKFPIAIVTDSTADMPRSVIEDKQIHVIPLNLHFAGNQYIDRVTITPDTFYKKLKKSKEHPTTSQPGKKEFINKFSYLATHYESIIGIFIANPLSGTYQNAVHAAKEIERASGKKISIIDSKTISAPLGLMTLRIIEALEKGADHDELLNFIDKIAGKAQVYVSVKTLKYFVRGGRVSPVKGLISRILNMNPVIKMDRNGRAVTFGKFFSRNASIKAILKEIDKLTAENKVWNYALLYANKEEKNAVLKFGAKLEAKLGKPPHYIERVSPVVGVNAGIGTIAVGFLME